MADPSTNPYLALLQQQDTGPTWAQILQNIGNLGFGLAGGFGQAAATGQPTMAGIGPGLMMGNQMNVQAANAAEQDRLKRAEIGLKAQEYEDKRTEMLRKQKAAELFTNGFNVTPQPGPVMGPTPTPTPTPGPQLPTPVTPQGSGYDTKVAGAEGGTRNGGMVFNELGSGAFGPYQFMPATWAAVRAQNPSLNLPEDMTQATREQHDAAHGAFKAGNAQGLQAAGFQPTPDNLYLAHRFGLGGATSVLRADPDKPLSEVLPIDWQRQNPDMRGQTAGGFRRLAAERVGGVGVPYVVRPDAKPVQYSGPTIEPGDSPDSQPPSSMTPVMPQPKWETPGDVMPVNPSAWFSTPPPPAPAPPASPAPGGPNVVQPQYVPQPGQPTMAPPGGGPAPAPGSANPPPVYVPPPVPRLDPQTEARINAGVVGQIITPEKGIELKRQLVEDQYKKAEETAKAQYTGQLEIWKQREQVATEQRKIDAQKAAEQRKLETDLVTVRDQNTNDYKSVTKAEAVAGVTSGRYIPLDAETAKLAAQAAQLAKDNAARTAANQRVNIDPATGQPTINRAAVEAEKEISAAQGTDTSSKILLAQANDAIERNKDWQKAGTEAGTTIRNMDIFSRLSEDIKTGKFTGATTDLKAKLKGAGVNLEAWGIPDNVGPAQAMQMMSQRFALEMRREMPGPMSDGDRKFMERGAISIENDPGANKIMSAYLKGNAERAQDRAKFAREYMNSPDFTRRPAAIDDYVEQKLATKDYFDSSVLPKDSGTAKTPWDLEIERRGRMNSAAPPGR